MPNFFDKYPYTDFHELNLDWIIKTVKETVAEWAVTLTEWHNTQEEWQQLYNYVHDYFENLDVQEEVNIKVDELVADGTMAQIADPIIRSQVSADLPAEVSTQIGPTVASQIDAVVADQIDAVVASQITTEVTAAATAWLADNITNPSNPPIDTSLLVGGAAADAEVTGDTIKLYSGILNLVSGGLNVLGNIVANNARMTTGMFYVLSGFTITVNPGYDVSGYAGASAPYTDLSYIILNGGSYHRDVTDGPMFGFTVKRVDNTDFTPADDPGFRIVFDDSNDALLIPLVDEVKALDIKTDLFAGYKSLISGYIAANRNWNPNTARATTGIFYIEHPCTIRLNSGWQAIVIAGTSTGTMHDYGWVIVNGGSFDYDLSYGNYIAINIAKSDLSPIDPTTENGGLRILFDGSNDKLFYDGIDSIISELSNADIKPVYTVDINGGGDYTSLLDCLKDTPDNSIVKVMPGVYDQIAEYEAYYGANYFVDYTGYDLSDIFSRGYWISDGRVLDLKAGAVIQSRYVGNNASVRSSFSVLNTGHDATVIGGYYDYSNLRYCVHDDAAFNNAGTNTFRDMVIHGFPSDAVGLHWGGGCGKANTYYIDNIIFLDDEMPAGYGDIYYHNNTSAGAVNRIQMNSCYGSRGAQFIWMGSSSSVSYVMVSGCTFTQIICRALDLSQPYENMKLIKNNCTETI